MNKRLVACVFDPQCTFGMVHSLMTCCPEKFSKVSMCKNANNWTRTI